MANKLTPTGEPRDTLVFELGRGDASLLAGGAATVLTLTWPFWRDIILVRVAAVPLSPGLLLSTEPYGGPFNASFNGPMVIMASVINGVLLKRLPYEQPGRHRARGLPASGFRARA